jgi:hypothetical protein
VLRGHRVELFSVSAFLESCSKSACTFPVISNAVCVFRSSAVSRLFCRRSRSTSVWSAVRRFFDLRARPSRAPASACLRYSEM